MSTATATATPPNLAGLVVAVVIPQPAPLGSFDAFRAWLHGPELTRPGIDAADQDRARRIAATLGQDALHAVYALCRQRTELLRWLAHRPEGAPVMIDELSITPDTLRLVVGLLKQHQHGQRTLAAA